ncbi:MAG: 5'-nucleotidase C-terminal domain-containing protein [Ignavibacteria bacterium]
MLQGSQGGIARAATVIGLTKISEPNVLTLHAGDVFIGDLFFNVYFGVAEFQLLNSLGLDAMTVGNHEWDLTPAALLGALQNSFLPGEGFPLLSSNLIFPINIVHDTLQDYISTFTIKEMGNLKVGIFGLTTPEANVTSLPGPYFIDTNIVEITAAMVDTLKADTCDVIILLSHLGLYLDQAIASYVPGINVIVGGHDHYLLEAPISVTDPLDGTTWIVQANSNYLDIGKLQLLIDGENVSLLNYEIIPLDESIPEEPSVLNEVNNLIAGIENVYGPVYTQQVGYANEYFDEVADSLLYLGNHDTPIGNLVTDAFRSKTGTDIAIEAGGSTAQPIYQGPLVAADIFRVVGYGFNEINGLGFRIVKFDILGSDLWTALETVLSTIDLNDELFPQVSGMKYRYYVNKSAGERLAAVTVGEDTLDPAETYSVTGNEFLVEILTSSMGIPISNPYLFEDSTEFQVLSEYIIEQQNISPFVEGRIVADTGSIVSVQNADLTPKNFLLKQNYPNPFNPATNFEFRIADFELVSLKVYDILGNEVATIVNEELTAGNYKYQWNASGLASGVYFYQLQAGNFVSSKKLILMK